MSRNSSFSSEASTNKESFSSEASIAQLDRQLDNLDNLQLARAAEGWKVPTTAPNQLPTQVAKEMASPAITRREGECVAAGSPLASSELLAWARGVPAPEKVRGSRGKLKGHATDREASGGKKVKGHARGESDDRHATPPEPELPRLPRVRDRLPDAEPERHTERQAAARAHGAHHGAHHCAKQAMPAQHAVAAQQHAPAAAGAAWELPAVSFRGAPSALSIEAVAMQAATEAAMLASKAGADPEAARMAAEEAAAQAIGQAAVRAVVARMTGGVQLPKAPRHAAAAMTTTAAAAAAASPPAATFLAPPTLASCERSQAASHVDDAEAHGAHHGAQPLPLAAAHHGAHPHLHAPAAHTATTATTAAHAAADSLQPTRESPPRGTPVTAPMPTTAPIPRGTPTTAPMPPRGTTAVAATASATAPASGAASGVSSTASSTAAAATAASCERSQAPPTARSPRPATVAAAEEDTMGPLVSFGHGASGQLDSLANTARTASESIEGTVDSGSLANTARTQTVDSGSLANTARTHFSDDVGGVVGFVGTGARKPSDTRKPRRTSSASRRKVLDEDDNADNLPPATVSKKKVKKVKDSVASSSRGHHHR